MKIVGLITEYNPFHNGHKYHIEKAKELTGADYVIAVMSGNFVQRGTPAITDKYARTMMALNNGVDLVFELPVCYSTSSAQYFALGAVSLLNHLGIVDYICFGSECGDIDILMKAADFFINSPDNLQNLIYTFIKEGYSYPVARAKAAEYILSPDEKEKNADLLKIISEPNNILGIEYIRALRLIKSDIKPLTIKRYKAGYHDTTIYTDTAETSDGESKPSISSATAIRNVLENPEMIKELPIIKSSVPEWVYDYLTKNYNITYPVTIEDFSSVIKYKLLSESKEELETYLDLSSDLADRIKNTDLTQSNISKLSMDIKSKNVTLTRIYRALIHVLLNIKTETIKEYIANDIIYYARILGLRKEASHLVRMIKKHGDIPVITKVANAYRQLDSEGMSMLNRDIFASHLYNQAVYDKFKTVILNEYKHGICIL
ncbi:putative nucleotidyltransferase [Herbinix hemicellulosilytica]|uniref:tRNA(Met) cytidine acetate ligase n=1 Tax=Herbinix hemicellulosilytica TaxID=1564487 RepID=A0A0H5SG49_HERHM|nr:nucleotidyltransferase [Herbinix hemicellulosilytica]RBP60052.1 putative nucleotidyltransferase [Herbinix hemicellulosilytica]CRZ33776.1 hypothetical protein HHT355_0571 [Herbinix hemicellulosilytica]